MVTVKRETAARAGAAVTCTSVHTITIDDHLLYLKTTNTYTPTCTHNYDARPSTRFYRGNPGFTNIPPNR